MSVMKNSSSKNVIFLFYSAKFPADVKVEYAEI